MKIFEAYSACLQYAEGQRSQSTSRTYRNSLNHFSTYLDEHGVDTVKDDLDKLSPDHFVLYPSWLSSNFSKKTCGVYIAGVKYFLDWCCIMGYMMPDYTQTVRLHKAIEQVMKYRSDPMPKIPVRGHLEKMIDAVHQINYPTPIKERDLALLLFLSTSGCRNNEAAKLTVGDIDLVEHQVVITGKREKQRFAFFDEETAQALRNYWKARGWSNQKDPAFARHDKGAGKKREAISTATVRNIVADVVKVAGIDKGKFTPHYFRHAFAIKMLSETGNLATVQDLLGHVSPATTRIYATIYPEDLKAAHQQAFKK